MDLIIFIISVLIFSGLGKRILGVIGVNFVSEDEETAFSAVLGFGLAAYAIFVMGITGLLYKQYLGVFLLMLVAVSFREICSIAVYFYRLCGKVLKKIFSGSEGVFVKVIILFIFIAVIATLIGALTPPLGNDSLAYRLAQVRIYAENHAVAYVPYTRESLWPNLTEMLFTYGMVMGSDTIVKLFAWSFGILGGLFIFAAAKRMFSGRAAVFAAAVFLLTPAIFTQMTYAYVDIALAVFCFASLLSFINFAREGKIAWAAIAGIFAGFVMSVKYSGVIAMAGMVCVVLYFLIASADKKTFFKGLLLMGIFGFLFSCAWYLRAFIVKGNPVYPYLAETFSGNGWSRNAESLVGSQFSLKSLILVPWRTAMYPGEFGGENVGIFFLMFSPLIFLLRNIRKSVPLILFSSAYICIWFFVDPYVLRFVFPALLPLAVVMGGGIDAAIKKTDIYPAVVKSAFLGACILSVGILMYHTLPVAKNAVGVESRDSFLSRYERTYDLANYINDNLPESATILLVNEIRVYYMKRPYVHLRNLIDEKKIDESRVNDGTFLEDLEKYGIEYVVFLEGETDYQWINELVDNDQIIYEDRHLDRDGMIYEYKIMKIKGQ